MQENCIKIHKGTKESRSLIEIQSYITQLEMLNNKLKKKLIETETLSQRYEILVNDYKRIRGGTRAGQYRDCLLSISSN